MNDVGFIIQNHLELKNMTQERLGKKVGLSQKAISKYITGKSLPPLDVLDKICHALDIEPSVFFTSSHVNKLNCEYELYSNSRRTISHSILSQVFQAKQASDYSNDGSIGRKSEIANIKKTEPILK